MRGVHGGHKGRSVNAKIAKKEIGMPQTRQRNSAGNESRLRAALCGRSLHYTLLAAAVAAFLLVFSVTTSPLTPGYFGGDSAVFQLLGRAWANGKVIYRDLFDHKGPLIFFIDMLGERLSPGRTGIILLQAVFGCATAFGLYETARLRFSPMASLGLALGSLFCLVTWYGDGGNMTEEYCLPFLTWSLYFVVRYGLAPEGDHPPLWAALYGAAFAACVLTRLTNAICLSVWVLCIVVHLVVSKRYQNLLKNAAGFLAGFLLLTLPFVVYFAANGALGAFWFGTIGMNVSVADANTELEQYAFSAATYLRLAVKYVPLWLAILGGALSLARGRHRLLSIAMVASAALFAFWVVLFHTVFLHYQMVNLPLAVPGLILCLPVKGERGRGWLETGGRVLAGLLAAVMLATSVDLARRFEALPGSASYTLQVRQAQDIAAPIQTIPAEERSSVAVYNIPTDAILTADLLPCYPYSVNIEIQMEFSMQVQKSVEAQFESLEARWIYAGAIHDPAVAAVIARAYEPISCDAPEGYTLYRRLPAFD